MAFKTALVAVCATILTTSLVQAQTVVVMRAGDAPSYDPQRAVPAVTSEVVFMLGDTLVALDYDMKTVHPLLAKSWDMSPDGKTYIFHLREDVSFCSGKKFTSADVLYTFSRLLDPTKPKPSAAKAGNVKSITAPDLYTVVYELNEPFNDLLPMLSLFHATIINKENVEALGDNFGVTGFDGTGPMCWASWAPRGDTVLKRHAEYKWGPALYQNPGPSKIERIIFRTVPEDQTRLAAMLTGQGDITMFLPLFAIKQIQAAPALRVVQTENYFRTCFYGLKVTRQLMADKAVREAMNLAMDRNEIAHSIFFDTAIPATSFVHPGVEDFDQQSLQFIEYNPEKAKLILDRAGWKPGLDGIRSKDGIVLKPTAIVLSSGIFQAMSVAFQGYLRRVGIDLEIQTLDPTIFFGRRGKQDYDMFALCNPYVDVGEVLTMYWSSGSRPVPNAMMWQDGETDNWLQEGSRTLLPSERKNAYKKIQERVTGEFLFVPVAHDSVYLTQSRKLKDIRPHAIFTSLLYKGLDLEMR